MYKASIVKGDVVGMYVVNDNIHGFLLSQGTFTSLDVPGAGLTVASGINDVGQIVGTADTDGFLYDIATQTFTRFSYPGASVYTFAQAINNSGTIVGNIQVGGRGPSTGFALSGTKYVRVAFPRPNVPTSYALSVNNSGMIIGNALTVRQQTKGFSYFQGKYLGVSVPGDPNALALGLNARMLLAGGWLQPIPDVSEDDACDDGDLNDVQPEHLPGCGKLVKSSRRVKKS